MHTCEHAHTEKLEVQIFHLAAELQDTMGGGGEPRHMVTGPEHLVILLLPSRHRQRTGSESRLQRPTHSGLLRSHLLKVPQPPPAVPTTSWGPDASFIPKPHCYLAAHAHPSPELLCLTALSCSKPTLDSLSQASGLPLHCSGRRRVWQLVASVFGVG